MSTYLMVTLYTPPLRPEEFLPPEYADSSVVSSFLNHQYWDDGNGWKNWLNNLRLVLLPWVSFNLFKPWLEIFPIPQLVKGFESLIAVMNQFPGITVPIRENPP